MRREAKKIVQKEDDGLSLIEWLTQHFTYLSYEEWQDRAAEGHLYVNGQLAGAEIILQHQDLVQYVFPEIIEPQVNFDFKTIFEDEHVLILNKPANLPCHPAGCFFKNTLWACLKDRFDKVRLVNRLDRETSGIIVIAKTKEADRRLSKQFTRHDVQKEYLALVHGELNETIDAKGSLHAAGGPVNKKRHFIMEDETGEWAETLLEPISYPKKGYTLVRCLPKTGRLHQIRATLCSLGFPLVGDKMYGLDENYYIRFVNSELSDDDLYRLELDNQALHSWKLHLPDYPSFEAAIPDWAKS
ncbi:MAG: RluA family pseudouridine synthase [Lentisphaeria bacterium]|nr:RluA family pseudouridine synthase [Lentisphaeria bacterium]